jgi:germination protein YpeB
MKLDIKSRMFVIVIILSIVLIISTVYYAYTVNEKFKILQINKYNESFGNLANYVNNVESLLAKSTISRNPKYSAESLTEIWRDSNLALVYLNNIPISSEELSQTAKFLNQVSDYSYSLSRKNINDEELSESDFNNLRQLHKYSVKLEETLNRLSDELYSGTISWNELTKKTSLEYAQAVDNVSIFSNISANLSEYEGLIYDGAYSDHVNKADKVGLVGDEISEDDAYKKVQEFFGQNRIEDIQLNQFLENANIPCYDFLVTLKNQENKINIEIAQKGVFVVEMQNN